MIKNQKGFGLVESMIALVILVGGLLTISGVHSDFISSLIEDRKSSQGHLLLSALSADSRATTYKICSEMDGVIPAHLVYDTNVYTVSRTSTGDDLCSVSLKVEWSHFGLKKDIQREDMKIYVMGDEDITESKTFTSGEGGVAGNLSMPFGKAEYGTAADELPDSEDTNIDDFSGLSVKKAGDTYYLVDTDNANSVLLKQAGNQFTVISGSVFLDMSSFNSTDRRTVYVGAPDISICRTQNALEDEAIYLTVDGYMQIPYRCYMGVGWYGNIGVLSIDSTDGSNSYAALSLLDNNSCVGDNAVDRDADNDFSSHPVRALTRTYVGNKSSGYPDNKSYFISGMPECDDSYDVQTSCTRFSNHNFLVTVLSGISADTNEKNIISNDDKCDAPLEALEKENTGDSVVEGNPGKYVCITTTSNGKDSSDIFTYEECNASLISSEPAEP